MDLITNTSSEDVDMEAFIMMNLDFSMPLVDYTLSSSVSERPFSPHWRPLSPLWAFADENNEMPDGNFSGGTSSSHPRFLSLKGMSTPSSSVSWKASNGVSDPFPAGLRVLVVDNDLTSLRILEKMLRNCLYEVTKCNRAESALSLLRENKSGYDIVISDLYTPGMDGFKLLEHVRVEMDLPVILMSADDSKHMVMKGAAHGASNYLIKPVRIEELKNIWQHVFRKKKYEWKDKEFEQSGSVEDGDRQQKASDDVDCSSSANEGNWKNSKKRKEEEKEAEETEDTSTLKKPLVVWSVKLHQKFVAAVNQLGIDKAVPKRILDLMNVPGLTRENVASNLQKYRLYLRRLSGVSQHQNVLNNSFMGPPEAAFGSMPSLNGLDLQTLAASGQLSAQSLATLQAAGLGRSTSKSGMSMPVLDQRNTFSFENPKLVLTRESVEITTAPTDEGDATHSSTHVIVEEHVSVTQAQNSGRELEHGRGSVEIITAPIDEADATHSSTHVIVEEHVSLTQAQTRVKAKSPKRQVKGKRLSISHDDLKRHFGKPLKEVAAILGVSKSTIKRMCRVHGIVKWPFHKKNTGNYSLFETRNSTAPPEGVEGSPPILDRNPPCPSLPPQENLRYTGHASVQDTMIQDARTFTVKASYGKGSIIKFPLQSSSKLVELEEEVAKRLKVKVGSFSIEYQDEENEWISLTCDADLQFCMKTLTSFGEITIRMSIHLDTN